MNKLLIVLFTISLYVCKTHAEPNEQPGNRLFEIPLQGNAYTTAGTEVIDMDNGALDKNLWTDSKTIISTYFRTSKDGDLQLSLKYSAESNCKIKVSYSGKDFIINCKKGAEKTVFIGKINQVKAGYIKVDFQGMEKSGATFANITSLLIGGKSTEGMIYYVNNPDFYYWGRRGPSVHMNYTLPEGNVEWFYNEVTVPEGYDPIGSYFMANGFGEGYFGMQVNSETERRVLFSVWSPFKTDNPDEIPNDEQILLNKKGKEVTSQAFGGEGSGRQNFMNYMWKAGITYKFLLRCQPDPDKPNYTLYTAYFNSPEDGWMLVASNSRPKIVTYYTHPHSFLENFNPETGFISRKVYFDNQWAYVKGKGWQEVINGRFTCDNTGNQKQRMDFKGGIENNKFYLQNCGFFSDFIEGKTPFKRNIKGVAPVIDFDKLP